MKLRPVSIQRRPKSNHGGNASFALVLLVVSVITVFVLGWLALTLRPNARRSSANSEAVRVYCAAGIAKPVELAIADYNKKYEANIVLARVGGSGELAGQIKTEFESGIQDGADLYITADDMLLRQAADEGIVAETFSLAIQKPVIAVAANSTVQIDGLVDLVTRSDLNYGITSDKAAIGKMARDIAAREGVLDQLEKNKRTDAENVMTLAQALVTGSLDATILWDSTVEQINRIHDKPVLKVAVLADKSDTMNSKIGMGVVSTTNLPTDVLKFARYLAAPNGGSNHFLENGFVPTPGDVWDEVPEIHLYCGSMFTPVLEETVREFSRREGVNVYPRWEGCGKLVASMLSIQDSDMFPDAYLACDEQFLKRVQDRFEPPVVICSNQIVMAIAKSVDREIKTPFDLVQAELRVGLCDPEQSALGYLTKEMLSNNPFQGLYDRISMEAAVTVDVGPTLISQLSAGGLDVAFVYRSNVVADPIALERIKIVSIDDGGAKTARAIQPWAISKTTRNRKLMDRLLKVIVRDDSQARFRKAGFDWQLKPDSDVRTTF